MSKGQYSISPRADADLDDQAIWYASSASPELGHCFLVSAHETFSVLSMQPEMGWRPRLRLRALRGLRVFMVNGFEKILILYRPMDGGVEIVRVVSGSQDLRRLIRRQGNG